jgi:hypothetical protein
MILAVYCWMPWWMVTLERTARGGKPKDALGAGLVFSILLLSSNYQMSLLAAWGGLVYFMVRRAGEWRSPEAVFLPAKAWLQCAGFFMWGLVPSFLWVIPSMEMILHSARFQAPFDYLKMENIESLNLEKLWEFIFPVNSLKCPPLECFCSVDTMGFLGLFAPVLFFFALRKTPLKLWLWTVFALLALGLAFGPHLPFHRWACEWIPAFRFMWAPARTMAFYSFSGSVLAAAGIEPVLGRIQAQPKIRFMLQGVIFISLLIPFWICVPRGSSSILMAPGQTPFLTQLKGVMGFNRVFIWEDIPYPIHWEGGIYQFFFPVNAPWAAGLRGANGYESLRLRNYAQFGSLPFDILARLLAVQWKASPANATGVMVSQMIEPHPFVWAAGKITVLPDFQSVHQTLARLDYDPYCETLLREVPPGEFLNGKAEKIFLQWTGRDENPDEESFQVKLSRPALVVFSEVDYPGWRALMDGVPAQIYEADGLLRAVAVPEGNHEIRFSYRPFWLFPCVMMALLWFLSLPLAWRVLGRDFGKNPPLK